MSDLSIKIAQTSEEIQDVRNLLLEYGELRKHDSALGNYEKELALLPGKYTIPEGVLLIAYFENEPAGCVAFQSFSDGICEMKRMFVLPRFQGNQIGKEMMKMLLKQAKKIGYKKMYLDTHPWMKPAQNLYQKFGFTQIERYNNNPTPGIIFFEKEL